MPNNLCYVYEIWLETKVNVSQNVFPIFSIFYLSVMIKDHKTDMLFPRTMTISLNPFFFFFFFLIVGQTFVTN